MRINTRPSNVKPPFGSAKIDWGHPLSQGFMFGVLCQDSATSPFIIRGPSLAGQTGVATGNPVMAANPAGSTLRAPDTSTYFLLGTEGAGLQLPSQAATVAVIRRKTDTTARDSAVFGLNEAVVGERIGSHCPWSDGVVYWDFGGSTAPNRISYTWKVTTNVERFVFVAGSNGSAIYLNGALQVSQTTGLTRTVSSARGFYLNAGQGGIVGRQDIEEYNAFFLFNAQWTAPMVKAWTFEPYAFLTPVPSMRYWSTPPAAAVAAGSVVSPRSLSLLGVGA